VKVTIVHLHTNASPDELSELVAKLEPRRRWWFRLRRKPTPAAGQMTVELRADTSKLERELAETKAIADRVAERFKTNLKPADPSPVPGTWAREVGNGDPARATPPPPPPPPPHPRSADAARVAAMTGAEQPVVDSIAAQSDPDIADRAAQALVSRRVDRDAPTIQPAAKRLPTTHAGPSSPPPRTSTPDDRSDQPPLGWLTTNAVCAMYRVSQPTLSTKLSNQGIERRNWLGPTGRMLKLVPAAWCEQNLQRREQEAAS
jgi:hypothetical protein